MPWPKEPDGMSKICQTWKTPTSFKWPYPTPSNPRPMATATMMPLYVPLLAVQSPDLPLFFFSLRVHPCLRRRTSRSIDGGPNCRAQVLYHPPGSTTGLRCTSYQRAQTRIHHNLTLPYSSHPPYLTLICSTLFFLPPPYLTFFTYHPRPSL